MSNLAKRAIACKHWRWMPGMLAMNDWRVLWSWPSGTVNVGCSGSSEDRITPDGPLWYPDLTDPATLGCLLALVREALGCDCAIRRWSHGWALVDAGALSFYSHVSDTEAEALVVALEAAEGLEVSYE